MQIAGPFQPVPGVDLLTWMQQSIDSFTTVGGALLPIARNWGFCFAALLIAKTLVIDGLGHIAGNRPSYIAVDMIFCFARIAFINFVITYWIAPIPVLGVSFPDIFTLIGKEFAGVISMVSLDQLLDQLNACWNGLQRPPLWNFFGLVVYFLVLLGMSALDGVLFFIMFMGFFAVALGKVFGCIMAALYLCPFGGLSSKFSSLLNFLWTYSMYRATAAAWVLVVSTFMIKLFDSVVHGAYDLGHMSAILVILIAGILASVLGAFKAPHFNAEIFGGGHAGGDFGSSVRGLFYLIASKGLA